MLGCLCENFWLEWLLQVGQEMLRPRFSSGDCEQSVCIWMMYINLLRARLKYYCIATWWRFGRKQLPSAMFFWGWENKTKEQQQKKESNSLSQIFQEKLGSKSLPAAGISYFMRYFLWQHQVVPIAMIRIDEDVQMRLLQELMCSFWTSNFSSVDLCLLIRV